MLHPLACLQPSHWVPVYKAARAWGGRDSRQAGWHCSWTCSQTHGLSAEWLSSRQGNVKKQNYISRFFTKIILFKDIFLSSRALWLSHLYSVLFLAPHWVYTGSRNRKKRLKSKEKSEPGRCSQDRKNWAKPLWSLPSKQTGNSVHAAQPENHRPLQPRPRQPPLTHGDHGPPTAFLNVN